MKFSSPGDSKVDIRQHVRRLAHTTLQTQVCQGYDRNYYDHTCKICFCQCQPICSRITDRYNFNSRIGYKADDDEIFTGDNHHEWAFVPRGWSHHSHDCQQIQDGERRSSVGLLDEVICTQFGTKMRHGADYRQQLQDGFQPTLYSNEHSDDIWLQLNYLVVQF